MIINCPHCKHPLTIELSICSEVFLLGRDLLNFYIKKSGKTIKTLGREIKIIPNQLSNMRNGRVAIGDKRAMKLAMYFNHLNYMQFITPRLK